MKYNKSKMLKIYILIWFVLTTVVQTQAQDVVWKSDARGLSYDFDDYTADYGDAYGYYRAEGDWPNAPIELDEDFDQAKPFTSLANELATDVEFKKLAGQIGSGMRIEGVAELFPNPPCYHATLSHRRIWATLGAPAKETVKFTALRVENRSGTEYNEDVVKTELVEIVIPKGKKVSKPYDLVAGFESDEGSGGNDFFSESVSVDFLPVEIDAFVYGESNRKINDCIQRASNLDEEDDVRVITGGHTKFVADIQNTDNLGLNYEWSFSDGVADSANTNKEINWNAPAEDDEVTLTLKIKDKSDAIIGNFEVKILPVKPRIVRVKFVDDGTGKIVTLKDSEKNAIIVAPQYDRIDENNWESSGGNEAQQADHKNEQMEVFKNESVAYVKGGKMKIEADLAATDLGNQIMGKLHTPSQHKDLSANTPLKMSVVDSSPSLTFINASSSGSLGDEFEVQDWSTLDYGVHTTFTSNQALGDGGKIQFYWESTLNWAIKVKDKDGVWVSSLGAGTTSDTIHRSLCVPDKSPIIPPFGSTSEITSANQAWEKVMQYSCDWAKGKSGGNAAANLTIVDDLWAGIDISNTSSKGARHNINYTFTVPCPFNVRDFCKLGLQGSCGHMGRFFSSVGAAQGLAVDVESIFLQPAAIGDAFRFATNVKDVDGDWCEYGGGPVGPNALWFYNTASPGNHTFNSYGGNVYDPTFGVKITTANWDDYLSNALSHYHIIDAVGPGGGITALTWKTKAQVIAAPNRVRFIHQKNYTTVGGIQIWPPFP